MRRLLLLLTLLFPPIVFAQSSDADLRARLIARPLFLRGLWASDKLHFKPDGTLHGRSGTVPFTTAGVQFDQLSLRGKSLSLRGVRTGLTFIDNVPKAVVMQSFRKGNGSEEEAIEIEIDAPPGHDFKDVLDTIFAPNLASLTPALPDFWQDFARDHFPGAAPFARTPDPPTPGLGRIGGGISPPHVLSHVEPEFSEAARSMAASGNVLVSLEVDTSGQPTHLRIVRPCGLGLDEKAIEAVQQYKFQPAVKNGVPVPVKLAIEINFKIFANRP